MWSPVNLKDSDDIISFVRPLMYTTIPRHSQPLPLLFFGGGDEQTGDGSRYNPTAIQFLKDDWIQKELLKRYFFLPPSLSPASTESLTS